MSIDYCVICDECGIIIGISRTSARQARNAAADSPYRAVHRSPHDFCRSCHVGRVGNARYDRCISRSEERALNRAKIGGDDVSRPSEFER
jgi:hypothetical protein